MTRLDHNRAQAKIAERLNLTPQDIKNVIVWGNHSSTQFPDVAQATAHVSGKHTPVYQAVNDDSWLKGEFIATVQQRGLSVLKARKLSSAMSAAKAACDHMRDWFQGTPVSFSNYEKIYLYLFVVLTIGSHVDFVHLNVDVLCSQNFFNSLHIV